MSNLHEYRCLDHPDYPGQWVVFENGVEVGTYPTLICARFASLERFNAFEESSEHSHIPRITICWAASIDDPRMGQNWFTPFYRHGYVDEFGHYNSEER
jgi:hypothetical protein